MSKIEKSFTKHLKYVETEHLGTLNTILKKNFYLKLLLYPSIFSLSVECNTSNEFFIIFILFCHLLPPRPFFYYSVSLLNFLDFEELQVD